ncbi:MAG: hypothetical protein ACE5IO_08540 [Thermoplasmata archaeon]
MLIAKFAKLFVLLGTVAWAARTLSWESIIACLASLAAFVVLEIREARAQERTVEPRPDRVLFREFLKKLPSGGSIDYIRLTPMAGPINRNVLYNLEDFTLEWGNAQHEFQDRVLEKKRKELLARINEFLTFSSNNTFPTDRGNQRVPLEWEIKRRDLFEFAVSTLERLAAEIVKCHQDLVRTGQKRLKSKI